MIKSILGNRYRILREIGTGGMAKVYLAEDINEGRMVAVKVLYAHFGEDVSYLQRFKREAKLAGFLDSPHIVNVIDYGSSRDTHYLVMEYVEGRDLRETLIQRGPFSWKEALGVIDQVCRALENANEYNIVHRDIKPQNVMITDGGIVKVLDFGIARARMLPSLTQSGFVGSPYYISPEQAMGEDVDIRSDIYSTGIVLYELLSGHVPFDSKSPWSIISKHIVSELPEFTITDDSIPPVVQSFIKRMVSKRPDDRFQTPTEVRKTIAAILAGEEISEHLASATRPAIDKTNTVDDLFQNAQKAIDSESWQQAVTLLTQVLNFDPGHKDATKKLAWAGSQARLAALYQAAGRAMEDKRWQEAIDELNEIVETDPAYKDSKQLLAKAEDGLVQHTSKLNLPQIYDNAMAAFEAGNYDEAEELFGRIKKMSPSYRQADALWAESRRRKTKAGGLNRLSDMLKSKPSLSAFPAKWIGFTALIVVAIVVAIILVSQNASAPQATGPSVNDLLAQAQTAINQDDISGAKTILNRILAADAENPDAKNLIAQLEAQDNQNKQLSLAIAAIAAKEWTNATEILEGLRATPDFEPETVTTLLCDAYLSRGKERLDKVSNPNDQATIRAALADFQAGQQLCPDNQSLGTQITFAANYLSAIDGKATEDAIIEALQPIIRTEPNYAGGQAIKNLYRTYLNRGDLRREAGNTQAAMEDYNLALGLNVDDLSAAQEKQAQLLQGLTPTDTPVPSETEGTETPTEASAPEVQATQPANPGIKYSAPVIIGPEPFANYAGKFTEIILEWEPVGILGQNEFYDVTIRYFVGEEPRYAGSGLIKETSWRVPVEAGYGIAGKDQFDWWVTVRLGGTSVNGQPDIAVSPSSEERAFIWKP